MDRTAKLFDEGDALLPLLAPAVRGQVALYGKGGRLVLDAIRAQGYDTLARRPSHRQVAEGPAGPLRPDGEAARTPQPRGCA